jgi:hypothetical protein
MSITTASTRKIQNCTNSCFIALKILHPPPPIKLDNIYFGQVLDMRGNNVTVISIKEPRTLTELYLSGDTSKNARAITQLYLSGNPIQSPET